MSGSEMMRNKDDVAAIMRKKQEAGMVFPPFISTSWHINHKDLRLIACVYSGREEKGRGCWEEVVFGFLWSGRIH